jgi:hypothetical protein
MDKGMSIWNFMAPARQASGSLFGYAADNPITPEMEEWMRELIKRKIKETGKYSGGLNYDDYGTGDGKGNRDGFISDAGWTSPQTGWSNTLGRADWKVNPETGDVTWTGGTAFDYDSLYGMIGDITNTGGFFDDEVQHYNPSLNIWK